MRFDGRLMSGNTGTSTLVYIFILTCMTVAIFANTLGNSFMWDDRFLILENDQITDLKNVPHLFTPTYWNEQHPLKGSAYRPLRTASFAVDYSLWGYEPHGYHVTNILLHLANVILVFFLVMTLTGAAKRSEGNTWTEATVRPETLAFMAAALFACHPVHSESVNWVKNRSDLICSVFMLCSLVMFIRCCREDRSRMNKGLYVLSLICFIASLMAKGVAVMLPVIMVVFALLYLGVSRKGKAILGAVPFMAVAFMFFFRSSFIGLVDSSPSVSAGGFPERLSAVVLTVIEYVRLSFFPVGLNAERYLGDIHLYLLPIVTIVAVIIVRTAIWAYKKDRIVLFALSWMFITLLPVSNIIYMPARPVAEQRLYIPSVGFCIFFVFLVDQGVKLLKKRYGKPRLLDVRLVIWTVIAVFSLLTVIRNLDWKDPLTFWTRTVEGAPKSARAVYNLGKIFSEMGDSMRAISSFEKAIELDSGLAQAYNNLGYEYEKVGMGDKAAKMYNNAIAMSPDIAEAYSNAGMLYEENGNIEEAVKLMEKATDINPKFTDAFFNKGNLYAKKGDFETAIKAYKRALELRPYDPEIYNNLGIALDDMGDREEALEMFKKAIFLSPDYSRAYNNLGVMYYGLGNVRKAIYSFKKTLELDPGNAEAYNNIGISFEITGKEDRALEMFHKAIEADPSYPTSYRNLAVHYYKEGQYGQAMEYMVKAMANGTEDPVLAEAIRMRVEESPK